MSQLYSRYIVRPYIFHLTAICIPLKKTEERLTVVSPPCACAARGQCRKRLMRTAKLWVINDVWEQFTYVVYTGTVEFSCCYCRSSVTHCCWLPLLIIANKENSLFHRHGKAVRMCPFSVSWINWMKIRKEIQLVTITWTIDMNMLVNLPNCPFILWQTWASFLSSAVQFTFGWSWKHAISVAVVRCILWAFSSCFWSALLPFATRI
jgi:hypothetical protein